MRGLELLPTDTDDGDIFEFTMPERHDAALAGQLDHEADDYYNGYSDEDYLADEYWDESLRRI